MVNKRMLTIFLVIFLIITVFNVSSGITINRQLVKISNKDFNGYIIQFREEPIVKYKNRFSSIN